MKGHLIFNVLLLGAHFGFTISNKDQRIVNGGFAVAKQFPYQVFFDVLDLSNLEEPIKWTPTCGGTFIYKRIILTAAYCFYGKPNIYAIKVYFGAVDKSNSNEVGQQQLVVKRSTVVIHNEYDPSTLFNDIALIKLPIDVALGEYIKPAHLPVYHNEYASKTAIVSGWGGAKADQPRLKYFNTSMISLAECRERLQKGVAMKIADSQICIAPSENKQCIGDSGGPLTVWDNEEFVLVGISSYGNTANCTINSPSVYTRVASYSIWLAEKVGGHNLYE